MQDKILQPIIPVTEDGVLNIEAIDPYETSDCIVLAMAFEEFAERITAMMIRHCPNRRVAHLVRYGRTERVRNKNLIRLWKIELPKLAEAFL